MKIHELRGLRSLRALNAFSTLVLGLKMLPRYSGEGYEEFLARLQEMPPNDQETMLREAVVFVPLEEEEISALVSFACDPNGARYTDANLKNLGMKELHELIVAVTMKIAAIKIDLVSEKEKKNSPDSPSISEAST